MLVIEVHGRLAALADRLENVVEQAARTRKATAAVAATRELRQTLMAIAELQASPDLLKAASKQALVDWIEAGTSEVVVRMLDFVIGQFGLPTRLHRGPDDERTRLVAGLMVQCLALLGAEGTEVGFGAQVDTSDVQRFVERHARERADRLEAEVQQRRVEAELRRREAQARPALEAREVRAIEGGVAAWQV